MKKIILMMGLLVVAYAVVVAAKWHFSPAAQHEAGHREVWYCPMHPHYTSDKPGLCPICGMTLVKREGHRSEAHALQEHRAALGEVPGYAAIHIEGDKQQLMGMRTTTVVKRPFMRTVRAAGYVAHDLELYEAQLRYLDAWWEYYAFRSRRPVKDEFHDSWREYYKAPSGRPRSAEFRQANLKLLKAEYELLHMGLSEEQLAKLREVKYGQPWVQPDVLFFREGHPFWVYAEIFESDLGFVDIGQKARIEIPAYGETLEGIVRAISTAVDQTTRTVRVRIELPDAKLELKDNMYVNVVMPVELDDSLLIPRDAVMMTGTRSIAFVQTAQGAFEPREIQAGWEGDGFVQVKSGLKEGEAVVDGANFLVDSESRLQAALEGGHTHGQ